MFRIPTAPGIWRGNIPARENTGNSDILSKHRETQGILFAQVENSLVLKVKNIAKLAAIILMFFQKLDTSAKSVLCM